MAAARRLHRFGVVFDIDGVLIRGKKVIPGAAITLMSLMERKVPHVIMTNGGGMTEEVKAAALSTQFNNEPRIDPKKMCLCHTPMRSLVEKYRHERVLVIGKRYDQLMNVVSHYGFTQAWSAEMLHAHHPLVYPDIPPPDSKTLPYNEKCISEREKEFRAIFIMMDPIYWGRELQILMDLLCSSAGKVGTLTHSHDDTEQPMMVYNACSDFQYVGEYDLPRYGAGAFRIMLEQLYHRTTGKELQQVLYGKPEKSSYEFAEKMLEEQQAAANESSRTGLKRIYMIGDNPETDIRGANEAGEKWVSILVRTGMYNEERSAENNVAATTLQHQPDYTVDSVVQAIELINSIEKQQVVVKPSSA